MLGPDLILTNGRIFTADSQHPWATALAVMDGKIAAVGEDGPVAAMAAPHTKRINLNGRLVLPGLCDAHIHLYHWLLLQTQLNLAQTKSRQEMLARLAAYCTTQPDGWIVGQGWNESRWGEQDFPTAAEIDAATGARPALLYRSDMHVAIANQAALDQAGITAETPDPPDGVIDRDVSGRPTGILHELAIQQVAKHIPLPTAAAMAQALRDQAHQLHALGITAVHDQRMMDGPDGPIMLAAYQLLREEQALKLRVNCNVAAQQLPALAALGLRSGFGDDWLRLGHVKVFADGSLGSRTAWMLEPFAPQTPDEAANFGVNVTPPDQMAAIFQQATRLGFPISVHAIGDRAIHTVLDIFEEVAANGPAPAIPHRIEHVQTIAPADIPRLARLGLTASVQPLHLVDDHDLADRYLGDRARTTYAFRSLLDAGTRLVFGSDAPVVDCNPFVGIHAACYRRPLGTIDPWHPDQSVSLCEAIRAYTVDAASAAGWHATIGSLTRGKQADLIVLDQNLFELDKQPDQGDAIAETRVLLTLIGGQIVHTCGNLASIEPT